MAIVYCLFFLSGTASLIYEITWGRMFLLIFGNTTNSIVAVVSAFLLGLALGSILFGKISDKLNNNQLLKLYALLELSAAVFAAATLKLLPILRQSYAYFSDGSTLSVQLLLIKFTLTCLLLLLPTIAMGGTLPVLTRLFRFQKRTTDKSLSYLYASNTFGAVLGIILAAYFLIELIGLRLTLLTAVLLNLFIATTASLLPTPTVKTNMQIKKNHTDAFNKKTLMVLMFFFLSGFTSIAYQVLWTRVLTPSLGTFIYAFAAILALFLFGIAFGSICYEKISQTLAPKINVFALCQLGIGASVLLSIIISHFATFGRTVDLLIRVLPPTLFMGIGFPAALSLYGQKQTSGFLVGLSYFVNTIGAVISGYLTSFIFLPFLGASKSLIFLMLINLFTAMVILRKKFAYYLSLAIAVTGVVCLLFFSDVLIPFFDYFHIQQAKKNGSDYIYKEDEIASVIGTHNKKTGERQLLIDGIGTTYRTSETRIMAHLPLVFVPDSKNALVVAFGMGSTYRSFLRQNQQTDAVELVPSVPQLFSLYHPDALQVLKNPLGKIIINDGRNYAFLTDKKYDVIIIDPPPPFNAAGTSILHSREFYQDLTKILTPGGVVSQWIFYSNSREDDILMALKSFLDVFPNVLAVNKKGGAEGLYMLGSFYDLEPQKLNLLSQNSVAIDDLKEVMGEEELTAFKKGQLIEVVGNRKSLARALKNTSSITDDRPRNEYYLLRHTFTDSSRLLGSAARDFIDSLRLDYQIVKAFTRPLLETGSKKVLPD